LTPAVVARTRRLLEVERHYPWFLFTTLLPILVLPGVNYSEGFVQRSLLPIVVDLVIVQALRCLPYWERQGRPLRMDSSYRLFGLVSAIAIWVPTLMNGYFDNRPLRLIVLVILSGFNLFTAVRIIHVLSNSRQVNARTLSLAAAGYAHLGVTGGWLATTLQLLDPGSFRMGAIHQGEQLLERLTYYSFITIGTLGYGDVLPGNARGERFAVLLSLSGTLYLTLLMGLLLSRFIHSEGGKLLEAKQDVEAEQERDGQRRIAGSESFDER